MCGGGGEEEREQDRGMTGREGGRQGGTRCSDVNDVGERDMRQRREEGAAAARGRGRQSQLSELRPQSDATGD